MSDMIMKLNGYDGQVSVYEDHIVIERKGFLGKMAHGLSNNEKSIPIDSIVSVQLKEGTSFVNGYLQFGVLENARQDRNILDGVLEDNQVVILKKSNDEARKVKEYLEERIFNRKNQNTVGDAQKTSAADEIKKFKELLDMGAISQEE